MENLTLRKRFQNLIEQQTAQKENDSDELRNPENFSSFANFISENGQEFRNSIDESVEILLDMLQFMKQISDGDLFNYENFKISFFPVLDVVRFCLMFCNEFDENDEADDEINKKFSDLYTKTVDFMSFSSSNLAKISNLSFKSENDVRIWSLFVEKFSQIFSILNGFGEYKVVLSSLKCCVQFINVSKLAENLKDRVNFDSSVAILCDMIGKLTENVFRNEFVNSNFADLENQSKILYVALKLLANLIECLTSYFGSQNVAAVLQTMQIVLTKVLEVNYEKSPKVLNLVEYFSIPIEPMIGLLMNERETLKLATNLPKGSATVVILVLVLDNLSKYEDANKTRIVLEKIFETLSLCGVDMLRKLSITFGKKSSSLYEFCYKHICLYIITAPASSFAIVERNIWNKILDSNWIIRTLAGDCLVFLARYAKKDLCLTYCNSLRSILNEFGSGSSKNLEHLSGIYCRLVKCLTKSQLQILAKSEFLGDCLSVTVSCLPVNFLDKSLLTEVIQKLTNIIAEDEVQVENFLLTLKSLENVDFEKLSPDQNSKIVAKFNELWKLFPFQSNDDLVHEIRYQLFKVSSNALISNKEEKLIFKLLEVAIGSTLLPREDIIVTDILARLSSYKPSDEKKRDIFNRCIVNLFRRCLSSTDLMIFNAALKNFNFFARNTADAKILALCVPENVRREVLQFVETNSIDVVNDHDEKMLLQVFF